MLNPRFSFKKKKTAGILLHYWKVSQSFVCWMTPVSTWLFRKWHTRPQMASEIVAVIQNRDQISTDECEKLNTVQTSCVQWSSNMQAKEQLAKTETSNVTSSCTPGKLIWVWCSSCVLSLLSQTVYFKPSNHATWHPPAVGPQFWQGHVKINFNRAEFKEDPKRSTPSSIMLQILCKIE